MTQRDDDRQAKIRQLRSQGRYAEYMSIPQKPPDLEEPLQQQGDLGRQPGSMSLYERWRAGYFTIVPEENRLLDVWDVLVILALVSLALALPLEVAFFKEPPRGFSLLNRAMDAVFTIDILVTFQVAYSVPDALSQEMYEREPIKIARHYMATPCSSNFTAGWFWPDILTVLPWDLLGVSSIRFVRVLRLLRMMRLVRVMKLCSRWHSRVGTSYAVFNIAKCALLVLMALHWLTCVWAFMAITALAADGQSWLKTYAIEAAEDLEDYGVYDVYNIAMYFCAMTLTGVGYGDVSPSGQSELSLCTITMFMTGFIWAWVIATIVSVVNNLDAFATHFQKINDELNMVMESRGLSSGLKTRCRKHLHEAYLIHRKRHEQLTIRSLSSGLQGEIHIASGADRTCNCVWYLRDLEPEVLVELVNYFNPDMFSPGEFVAHKRCVSVIRCGCLWWKGRGLTRDDIIGEDMILDSEILRDSTFPKTLTFVEVVSLQRDDLQTVCEKFPDFSRKIRMAQVRLAIRRGIQYYSRLARIRRAFQGPCTSERMSAPCERQPDEKRMARPRFCTANVHQAELMTAVTSVRDLFQQHSRDTKAQATFASPASAASDDGSRGGASGVDPEGSVDVGPAAAVVEERALSTQLTRIESAQNHLLDQVSCKLRQDAALSAQLARMEAAQAQPSSCAAVLQDASLEARLARIEAVQTQLLDRVTTALAERSALSNEWSTHCGSSSLAESPAASCKAEEPLAFAEVLPTSASAGCAAGAGTGDGPPADVAGADSAGGDSRKRAVTAATAAAASEQPGRLDLEARLAAMEKAICQRHDALEVASAKQLQQLHSVEAALAASRGPPATGEAPAAGQQRALAEESSSEEHLAGSLGAGPGQWAKAVKDGLGSFEAELSAQLLEFEASWRGRLEARLEAQLEALQEAAVGTVRQQTEALNARLHAQLVWLEDACLRRLDTSRGSE